MREQTSDWPTSAGAHPTNREFVDQLAAWGFTCRKEEGVHLVFRGPHGGTLRVVRSLLGRVDTDRVDKAARLIRVTTGQFWEGPQAAAAEPRRPAADADAARRSPASTDRVTSVVLGIHASEDRPLGFDQVVELAGGKVTRDQVRTASAQLCREGDLDRIRSGVYQWAEGARARSPQETLSPLPSVRAAQPAAPIGTPPSAPNPAAVLFDQLFPAGIRMTAEAIVDVARWSELTEKLVSYAEAS
jgi:hypothetical protein